MELEAGGKRSFYFIGPKNGGLELKHQRKEITVITPQSPLGQDLMGKIAGQRWTGELLAVRPRNTTLFPCHNARVRL